MWLEINFAHVGEKVNHEFDSISKSKFKYLLFFFEVFNEKLSETSKHIGNNETSKLIISSEHKKFYDYKLFTFTYR